MGYNTFLNGWAHYLRETPDNFVMAIQYFKKALELDPNYGRAYAALALTYWQSWKRLWHFRVGLSHWHDARFEAEKFLKKAMQNPTPLALQVNTSEFLHLKRYEEAIAEAEHAFVMDPNDADSCLALASVLSLAGRPEKALQLVRDAMRLNPDDRWSFRLLLATHGLLGRNEDAARVFETIEDGVKRGRQDYWDPLSIRVIKFWYLFRDPRYTKRLVEGLRKAGVPD